MFKLIRKFIGVACLFAGFASGQNTGQNVVSVAVIPSQVISASTVFLSPSVQNIGQTSHTLTVMAALTSGSTGGETISAVIQGSIDGVNWFGIGPFVNSPLVCGATTFGCQQVGSASVFTLSGFQSYQYLRTNVIIVVGVGDTVTISGQYQGSSSPSHNLVDTTGYDTSMLFHNIVANGSVSGTTSALTPVVSGSNTGSPFVYGLVLNYVGATTNSIFVGCGGSGVLTTSIVSLNNLTGAANNPIIFPSELRPLFGCSQGSQVMIQVVSSGTVASAVTGEIIYRNE